MIAAALLFILIGSFGTAIVLAAGGASWGMTALGYVAGGWGGLVLGGALAWLLPRLRLAGGRAARPRRSAADRARKALALSRD